MREEVLAIIQRMTHLPAEQVRSKTAHRDLVGADSLDIVELVMELEGDLKKNGGSSPTAKA
jgi:acyl carrier protein